MRCTFRIASLTIKEAESLANALEGVGIIGVEAGATEVCFRGEISATRGPAQIATTLAEDLHRFTSQHVDQGKPCEVTITSKGGVATSKVDGKGVYRWPFKWRLGDKLPKLSQHKDEG